MNQLLVLWWKGIAIIAASRRNSQVAGTWMGDQMHRLVIGVLMLICLCTAAAAQDQQTKPTDLFPSLFEKLQSDAALQSRWGSCPADLYRSEAPFWEVFGESREVEEAECAADPSSCHALCFEGRNGDACFSLARTFQDNSEEQFSRYWEALFAQACATGHDGACTNRGAGIRNGGYEDDPFHSKSSEERDSCLFRTFQSACKAGDAWGCAMHGQSYQYGEGVQADVGKAREFYGQSCTIDPDFSACDYAKGMMESLEEEGACARGGC